jgi:hypothetical protein
MDDDRLKRPSSIPSVAEKCLLDDFLEETSRRFSTLNIARSKQTRQSRPEGRAAVFRRAGHGCQTLKVSLIISFLINPEFLFLSELWFTPKTFRVSTHAWGKRHLILKYVLSGRVSLYN